MKKSYIPYLFLALLAFPQIAFAHPGHLPQSFMGGLVHPVTGFDHILAMIAVGLWAVQLRGRALWVLPASFVSVMVAGGLLGRIGLSLPFVEPMIAASVLVLGLLVASSARAPLWLGTVLVGFFAVFHGYAHIVEIGSQHLLTYILGFSVGTAALHAVGITLGMVGEKFTGKLIRFAGALTFCMGLFLIFSAISI